jgi:hypothetical protein
MDIFGDFGWVGAEDKTASQYLNNQVCINFYVEMSPSSTAKTASQTAGLAAKGGVALLGAPGLIQLVTAGPTLPPLGGAWPQPSSVTNLPVRGGWVLPGGAQALVAIANLCYLVTIATPATASSNAVLALSAVGTLLTSTGPVAIRDNGLGGYAVLVDGPNGYFYNVVTRAFTQITDPAFLGSNTVAFIDGWWVFNQPGTQTFYTNAQPYALTFNASYFANKDASSDKLVGVMASKEELWLVGERTTEIWYNAGGPYFPFQRLVGTMLQVGCKAPASIARFSSGGQDGLIWLGRSDRGENIVIRTKGFAADVVSTPAVSHAIAQYPVTQDAVGYTYQEDTHEFYVLTFPTADRTWVFDGSVPLEYAWTQRLSYDPYAQAWHRHRSSAFMNFAGMRIVGDYQNGSLYQLTRSAYTDAGWPLLARRRAPYVWDKGPRGRVFLSSLQLEFAPGQGSASGLGQNPVANLRISRDGTTFGQQWPAPMGAMGRFKTRTLWRRLAMGRNNLFEVDVIAPVNRDLIGATLKAFSEEQAAG